MKAGDRVVTTQRWKPDGRTGTIPKGVRGTVAFYVEPGWLVDFDYREDFASVVVVPGDPVKVVER